MTPSDTVHGHRGDGEPTAAWAAQFTVPVATDGMAVLKYRVRVSYYIPVGGMPSVLRQEPFEKTGRLNANYPNLPSQ